MEPDKIQSLRDHLLYLLSRAQLAPNFLRDRAHLRRDRSLTEVLAQWFISALERLLQEGLARDYRAGASSRYS